MKIVVDAFGGDNAPLQVIKGASMAAKELGVEIILTGDKKKIVSCAEENKISLIDLEIYDAGSVISMENDPTDILKEKSDSSMAVAFKLVADGVADAFVSAGSTGAVVVGGSLIVKRLKGIKRAALGTVLPSKNGSFMLMDVGANADCRPEMLAQFGIMASAYLKNVVGIENPGIGLLNIGTEETKGDELRLKSYNLLKNSPVNFIGNVEARELTEDVCDACITDGFNGNVTLKLYEGVSLSIMSMFRDVFKQSLKNKIAASVLMPGLVKLKAKFDYSEVGGAPLLGLKKPVIKAHGSSNAAAIKNAIKQAKLFVENDVTTAITNGLAEFEKVEQNEI